MVVLLLFSIRRTAAKTPLGDDLIRSMLVYAMLKI